MLDFWLILKWFWEVWEGLGDGFGRVWGGFWEGLGAFWALWRPPKTFFSCFGTFLGCLAIFSMLLVNFWLFLLFLVTLSCCGMFLLNVACWAWFFNCVGRAKLSGACSGFPLLTHAFAGVPLLSLASLARQWFACCLFFLLLYLASHASTALKRFRSYCCMLPLLSYVFALPVPY